MDNSASNRLRPILLVMLAMGLFASACGSDATEPTAAALASAEVASVDPTPLPVATVVVEATTTEDVVVAPTAEAVVAASSERETEGADQTSGYEPIEGCGERDLAFAAYIDAADMSCDDEFLYIESDNLADHEMMVGITAWNGQVPLPQVFYASNSWAIPLNPSFNEATSETTGQGPIAVAINGVMIFNPTQQSGIYSLQTDPNLIGELDECGGHSGRGDDYHYHVAPTCLEVDQFAIDADFDGIVAYAMDGYPIYTNAAIPDGVELDECGGLGTSADDYRYFASDEFPYVNGCFRGDFDMNLQPHAPSIRDVENGTPKSILITANYTDEDGKSHMEYLFDGVTLSVNYIANGDNCFDFEFVDDITTGTVRRAETYCRR